MRREREIYARRPCIVLQRGIVGRVPWCKDYMEPLPLCMRNYLFGFMRRPTPSQEFASWPLILLAGFKEGMHQAPAYPSPPTKGCRRKLMNALIRLSMDVATIANRLGKNIVIVICRKYCLQQWHSKLHKIRLTRIITARRHGMGLQ